MESNYEFTAVSRLSEKCKTCDKQQTCDNKQKVLCGVLISVNDSVSESCQQSLTIECSQPTTIDIAEEIRNSMCQIKIDFLNRK